jgi:hypothetical protein
MSVSEISKLIKNSQIEQCRFYVRKGELSDLQEACLVFNPLYPSVMSTRSVGSEVFQDFCEWVIWKQ